MYMDIDILQYGILCVFVAACVYFNHRSGYRQGILDGIDSSLAMLEQQKLIRIVELEDGNFSIEKHVDEA